MIKERTKFYNGYEKKEYMHRVIKEFLDLYKTIPEKGTVNKRNLEIIQLINEYYEKYIYFARLTSVIMEFLKNFYSEESNYISNFFGIKKSCKKQYELIISIKNRVKKVPIDSKYETAIKYTIEDVKKRLDYLLNNIVYTYLEMTPLLDYMKYLENNGKTLEDDISENIDLDENILDNPSVTNYVQKVLNCLNYSDSNCNYLKKKEIYENFLNEKYKKIEKEKLEKKQKQKENRFKETEYKLQKDASNIERTINNGNLFKYNVCVTKLSKKFVELKKEGYKYGRIILIGKTIKGYNAATYYLSGEELSKGLSNASVLSPKEEIPSKIQELINSKDYAIAEITIVL